MRISDWSSDVCSSDLVHALNLGAGQRNANRKARMAQIVSQAPGVHALRPQIGKRDRPVPLGQPPAVRPGPQRRDRKSGVKGKGRSVWVTPVGRRAIKKENLDLL